MTPVAVRGRVITGEALGSLCIYSVPDSIRVTREDLEEKFLSAGLDLSLMPPAVREVDVFRRATSRLERKRVPVSKGIFLNVLVREVVCDDREVMRQVVEETVDAKGRRLSYTPVAEISLMRRLGVMTGCELVPGKEALIEQARTVYASLCGVYEGDHVRRLITSVFETMSPTPMRNAGGVYFVPEQYAEKLSALEALAQALGCQFNTVPMIDGEKNRAWIYSELTAHLASAIQNLADTLTGGEQVTVARAKSMIDETKTLLQRVRDYEALLETNLNDLRADVEVIRAQLAALVDRVA